MMFLICERFSYYYIIIAIILIIIIIIIIATNYIQLPLNIATHTYSAETRNPMPSPPGAVRRLSFSINFVYYYYSIDVIII